jgi:hypothetical protein
LKKPRRLVPTTGGLTLLGRPMGTPFRDGGRVHPQPWRHRAAR